MQVDSALLDFIDDFGGKFRLRTSSPNSELSCSRLPRSLAGIPNDPSPEACQSNTRILSSALQHNASRNTLVFPHNRTIHLHHGVYAKDINNTVLQIDGELRYERPSGDSGHSRPPPCFMIDGSYNVTITSSGRGLINGRGSQYWGVPMIGYLQVKEHRPRLMRFNLASHLLIEKIILQDSPYHTLKLEAVDHVEIRNMSIVARRTDQDGHSWVDLTA